MNIRGMGYDLDQTMYSDNPEYNKKLWKKQLEIARRNFGWNQNEYGKKYKEDRNSPECKYVLHEALALTPKKFFKPDKKLQKMFKNFKYKYNIEEFYIATNNEFDNAIEILNNLGVAEYFGKDGKNVISINKKPSAECQISEEFLTSNGNFIPKPNPSMLKYIARVSRIPPQNLLYTGNSRNDVIAAIRAGWGYIVLINPCTKKEMKSLNREYKKEIEENKKKTKAEPKIFSISKIYYVEDVLRSINNL